MNHIFAMVVTNDLVQKAMNFNDAAIVSHKESNYRIHFWYMSKDDAVRVMNNSNLNEKCGLLCIYIYIYIYI